MIVHPTGNCLLTAWVPADILSVDSKQPKGRTMQDIEKYEAAARDLGIEHARNAASWVVDGNTPQDAIRRVVKLLDAGDDLSDYVPREPNLSGEYADDLTPIRLYEQVTGESHNAAEDAAGLGYETLVGSVVDALADAYEAGVSETFQVECERILRAALVTS